MKKHIIDHEKIHQNTKAFFKNIAILNLEPEEKKKLALTVYKQQTGDTIYWIELTLATVIATFGLLQDNVAVIIGAMLIAQLLNPIQGVAMGIATGRSKQFINSLKFLFKSSIVAILVSLIFATIVPLKAETAQILMRTEPTLLDFFIAIASGVIAFMALSYSRLTKSVAGVAMAAALLPPLCVIGIELAFSNFYSVLGSSLLYATNLLAIILVGILLFFLFGFSPHQQDEQKTTLRNVFVLIILVVFVCIPLFSSLMNIGERVTLQRSSHQYLVSILEERLPEATVSDINARETNNSGVRIEGVINLIEGVDLYDETQNAIRSDLEQMLNRNIELDLEVVRTVQIVTEEDKYSFDERVKEILRSQISSKLPEATIVSMQVARITGFDDISSEYKYEVSVIVSLPANNISIEKQQEIETSINNTFSNELININWIIVPEYQSPEEPVLSAEEVYKKNILFDLKTYFDKTLPTGITIENDVEWVLSSTSKPDAFSDSDILSLKHSVVVELRESQINYVPNIKEGLQKFYRERFENIPVTFEIEVRPYVYEKFYLEEERELEEVE